MKDGATDHGRQDAPEELLGRWWAPAQPEVVGVLRHSLVRRLAGIPVDRDAIELAVSEVVSNVVRHAYPDAPGMVTLRALRSGQTLTINVTDTGQGMPKHPTRAGMPPNESAGLGLGLGIVRAVADHVVITHAGPGTSVHMSFPIRD